MQSNEEAHRRQTEASGNDVHPGADEDSSDDQSTAETGRLPKDVVFELLASPRRRAILRYLDACGGEATRGELAEQIAADENFTEPAQITSQQRKRVYISLYQVHLPKMAKAEVLDYNQSRGTVSLRSQADQLFTYLYFDPAEFEGTYEEQPSRWKQSVESCRSWIAELTSTID